MDLCLERLGSNVEQCIFASHHILECAQLLIELCAIFQFSPYYFFSCADLLHLESEQSQIILFSIELR